MSDSSPVLTFFMNTNWEFLNTINQNILCVAMSIFWVAVIKLSLYNDIRTVIMAFQGLLQKMASTDFLREIWFIGTFCFFVTALWFNYLNKIEKFC